MNVCKPLIVHKTQHAINIVIDGWANLSWFLADGTRPNLKKVQRIYRALPDASDGAYSRDWLRQGVGWRGKHLEARVRRLI
jgi:hypothetical protein